MSIVQNTFLSINLVTVMISFPGNLFIIVVNILHLCKTRTFPLSDQLIFGFGVSNLLHGLQKGYISWKYLFQLATNEYDMKATYVFMYLNFCSLWFSTFLSMYFCLKIVNINHRVYICLQRRFVTLFPRLIITIVLGYFFVSLFSALQTNQERLVNSTSNVVSIIKSRRSVWSSLIFLTITGLCTFLCSVSALTILISLLKHMKRIQENTEGSKSPNMEAHIRAIKTVTTLLTANVLLFISVFLASVSVTYVYPVGILISVCHIISSYFLIKGTKKLDKTLVAILNQCSCFTGSNQ